MSHSVELRVMTLRSAAKINIATENSNTPELRRSRRIDKKRSYDKKYDNKTLNDRKRTKFQLPTLCNKSRLQKEITGNKFVKKQQDYTISKSKESGILFRSSDNNDVQTTSSPPAFENNSRLRVISDVISERDADMKLNTPSTGRHDSVTAGDVENNDFCPSPKNFEELPIILNKIWDRQQMKELNDDVI